MCIKSVLFNFWVYVSFVSLTAATPNSTETLLFFVDCCCCFLWLLLLLKLLTFLIPCHSLLDIVLVQLHFAFSRMHWHTAAQKTLSPVLDTDGRWTFLLLHDLQDHTNTLAFIHAWIIPVRVEFDICNHVHVYRTWQCVHSVWYVLTEAKEFSCSALWLWSTHTLPCIKLGSNSAVVDALKIGSLAFCLSEIGLQGEGVFECTPNTHTHTRTHKKRERERERFGSLLRWNYCVQLLHWKWPQETRFSWQAVVGTVFKHERCKPSQQPTTTSCTVLPSFLQARDAWNLFCVKQQATLLKLSSLPILCMLHDHALMTAITYNKKMLHLASHAINLLNHSYIQWLPPPFFFFFSLHHSTIKPEATGSLTAPILFFDNCKCFTQQLYFLFNLVPEVLFQQVATQLQTKLEKLCGRRRIKTVIPLCPSGVSVLADTAHFPSLPTPCCFPALCTAARTRPGLAVNLCLCALRRQGTLQSANCFFSMHCVSFLGRLKCLMLPLTTTGC